MPSDAVIAMGLAVKCICVVVAIQQAGHSCYCTNRRFPGVSSMR
jgi:hypothetical protein